MTQQHSTEQPQTNTPADAALVQAARDSSGFCVVYVNGARFLVDAESAILWRRRGLHVHALGRRNDAE